MALDDYEAPIVIELREQFFRDTVDRSIHKDHVERRGLRATLGKFAGNDARIGNAERLKLDLDKVKDWMKKGAQPTDRIMRFLDAAGVAKRKARNNPQKSVPRKERKANAETAAKDAEAAAAAAKAAKDAKAAEAPAS